MKPRRGRLSGIPPRAGIASNAARARARLAVAAAVVALLVAELLLAQAAFHFLALQLLIGIVAVALEFEVALTLALFELAIEFALALLGLGQDWPRAEGKCQGQCPEGMTKQGSTVHHNLKYGASPRLFQGAYGEIIAPAKGQKEAARVVSEGAASASQQIYQIRGLEPDRLRWKRFALPPMT